MRSPEQLIHDARVRYASSQREADGWARIAKKDFDALQKLLPEAERAEYNFNRDW